MSNKGDIELSGNVLPPNQTQKSTTHMKIMARPWKATNKANMAVSKLYAEYGATIEALV